MENSVQVLSNQIQIREWAGQRVVTFQDIDTVHQRPRGTASRNFRENRDKFIDGVDYFILNQPDEIRCVGITRPQGGVFDKVTLLTESGYLMIVKSLHDDLAWTVQRLLVNCYFKVKEDSAAPVEERTTTVSLVNHETILRAAAIMATCLDSTRYVVNLLRNIDPNIDQTPTVTVQVEDKPIEIPKLPEPETAVRELWRVTAPGGRLILPTYLQGKAGTAYGAMIKIYQGVGFHYEHAFTLETYRTLLEGLKLAPVTVEVIPGRVPEGIAVLEKSI